VSDHLVIEQVILSNLVGQKVLELKRNLIDLTSLKKGVYFVNIFANDGETYSERILVE